MHLHSRTQPGVDCCSSPAAARRVTSVRSHNFHRRNSEPAALIAPTCGTCKGFLQYVKASWLGDMRYMDGSFSRRSTERKSDLVSWDPRPSAPFIQVNWSLFYAFDWKRGWIIHLGKFLSLSWLPLETSIAWSHRLKGQTYNLFPHSILG